MKIGLIDLDNTGRFPNLALMKISAYHKKAYNLNKIKGLYSVSKFLSVVIPRFPDGTPNSFIYFSLGLYSFIFFYSVSKGIPFEA